MFLKLVLHTAGGLELLSDDWLECKGKRNGLLLELLCVDAAIVITLEVIVVCNSHPFFHVSPQVSHYGAFDTYLISRRCLYVW